MDNNSKAQNNSFVKRLILILVFFSITPLALFASVISLVVVSDTHKNVLSENTNIFESPQPGVRVYASLPSDMPSIVSEIISADARPEIIREYLKENNSPLEPYAATLVETADKYKLDYRLLTAIAQKESGLCRVIPEGSHNCWGWGIHSKGTLMFDSYEQGIETVSKGLKENYIDLGYITIDDIMKKYAHPDSTTWAEGVSMYMKQME
jgi:hypothetical protein